MNKKFVDTIFARRSIRKYTKDPVSYEDLSTLLKAAMASPSASNRRPWHFVVVQERKKLDELAEIHQYGKMLHEATLCVCVCGDPTLSERFWVQDCSAATENILLAAVSLGLGAVWLGVYPSEERVESIKKALGIPKSVIPLNLISIGHPAEEKEPRTQYDESRVHKESW